MSPPGEGGAAGVEVAVEDELSPEDRTRLVDGLLGYNREHGYVWDRRPLNVVARDGRGEIVGGLLGEVNHGWLFVALLWVREDARGSRVGSRIMAAAERVARERGCVGVFLDTYSFQARPFYEGLGYTLFGELPDYPAGATKHYLYKRLDGG